MNESDKIKNENGDKEIYCDKCLYMRGNGVGYLHLGNDELINPDDALCNKIIDHITSSPIEKSYYHKSCMEANRDNHCPHFKQNSLINNIVNFFFPVEPICIFGDITNNENK